MKQSRAWENCLLKMDHDISRFANRNKIVSTESSIDRKTERFMKSKKCTHCKKSENPLLLAMKRNPEHRITLIRNEKLEHPMHERIYSLRFRLWCWLSGELCYYPEYWQWLALGVGGARTVRDRAGAEVLYRARDVQVDWALDPRALCSKPHL